MYTYTVVSQVSSSLPQIHAACAIHDVRALWLFGSARGNGDKRFDPKTSDIDLVVEFNRSLARMLVDQFFDLLRDLELVLGRRVQLMTDRSINNPVLRQEIETTKELIYAAASQEAAA